MINYNVEVKLNGNQYTVPFPNAGQLLEIESMKILLTGGTYGQLARSEHKTATEMLDLVDAVAYFHVLIPAFKNVLPIEKFAETDAVMSAKVRKAFVNVYYPFFEKVNKDIEKALQDEDDSK